jgi:hypothetical protein
VNRFVIVTAALVAAVFVLVSVSLPPARLTLEASFADGTLPGIIHVHTNRSDGLSAPADVATAAARAGLRFVIFTDHGNGTRPPDPPVYRSGVLCIDAVEISTTGGHYLALDLPAAAPYPLAGEPRDVVEDVKRLGGFGIVAHPNSPKPALRWSDWDAPFDAIEWLNPDTSWRVKVREPGWRARWNVVAAVAGYLFRSPETIARLLGNTTLGADRWESFAHARRVVLLAGADAHAKLALASVDPGDNSRALPIPGYEASFRTMSVHAQPGRPLTGDAARDATTVLQALRRGHVYTAIDGLASPPAFQFTATNSRGTASEGDQLESGGPVTLHVRSNAPPSFLTILWKDAQPIATVSDQAEITRTVPDEPAIYRVEVIAGCEQGSVPWIISNPIYVGMTFRPAAAPDRKAAFASAPLFDGRTTSRWRIEQDRASMAILDAVPVTGGAELRLHYRLSGGTSAGQFAALGVELPGGAAPYDTLTFTARAEHPLRLSVQFRLLGRDDRWQRSVYLDEVAHEITVHFDDVTPVGATETRYPAAKDIHDILFVVETTHTQPGSAGRLWIRTAEIQR